MGNLLVPRRFTDICRRGATADLILCRYVIGIGGIYAGEMVDTVVVFDTLQKMWSAARIWKTPEVFNHATCVTGAQTLYLQGGCLDADETTTDSFFRLDVWTERYPSLIGRIMEGEPKRGGELCQFEFGMTWKRLPPPPTGGREHHTLTCDAETGCLYLFGGQAAKRVCFNDMAEFDPSAGTWRSVVQLGRIPKERCQHSMTYVDQGRLLLIGGLSANYAALVDVYEFDTGKAFWTELVIKSTVPIQPVPGCSTQMKDDCVVVLGGRRNQYQARCVSLAIKAWASLPDQTGIQERTSGQARNMLLIVGRDEDQENILRLQNGPAAPQLQLRAPRQPAASSAPLSGCCTAISADFSALLESSKLSDAVIILDDDTHIPVHMVVLAARCDYFDKMTQFHGKEVSHREIRIAGVKQSTMTHVLAFLYSGALPQKPKFEDAILIHRLADRLGIEFLKDEVAEELMENIHLDNLITLLNIGNETNDPKIVNRCSEYLRTHAKDVVKHNILSSLDQQLMQTVLHSILTADTNI